MSDLGLEKVKELASGLSLLDKVRLVEWLGATLEEDLAPPLPKAAIGWGEELVAALESGEIDTTEWREMDIPDSVEWLDELRRQERKQRGLEE